ncbi:MAG: sensor histidine kinase [Bacteroidetes bacterium]|nr:sensor histidine kinase [Bacteroidota bacterium]
MKIDYSFLLPPKTSYKDVYDVGKFDLTWKMVVFNSFFLFFVSFGYYFFEPRAFGASVYAWVIAIGLHVALYFFRKYRLIGFLYALHGCLFLVYTLNFMPYVIHAIEFFWMIVFTLYTFFAIGKKAGYLTLIINFAGIFNYFYFHFQDNILFLSIHLETYQVTATVLNICGSFVMIAYLLRQFKNTTSFAEKKFKAANAELENRNRLVQAQNEEKTIMLKEIHHRVKNNLQVITSLLRLQSREIDDEKTKAQFQDAVQRIIAMSLIHEKMYQNENLSKIDLKDYLDTLAVDLIKTYAGNIRVSLDITSKLDRLGNNTLVPVALIFNELISNSLKHAFANCDHGQITVDLFPREKNMFELMYKDNGTWSEPNKEGSFGLELIETLTEQLDGKVERTSENGTVYRFLLKNIE